MLKDYCDRCGEYKYINWHHILPKMFFGSKDNDETVTLCLDCHAEIHEQLPKSEQTEEFYRGFTAKFIGIVLVLIIFIAVLR